MSSWDAQEAGARFGQLLDEAVKGGPQIITQRGIEIAVLVPIEEWKRLLKAATPSLKELLLSPEPRFENVIPERRKWRRRPVVKFE